MCRPVNGYLSADSLEGHGRPDVLVVPELGAVLPFGRHLLYAGHRRLQPAPGHSLEPRHGPGELQSDRAGFHSFSGFLQGRLLISYRVTIQQVVTNLPLTPK